MELNLHNSRLSVAREGLIALRDAQGTRLTAQSGAFWITNEGNIKDHILGPGDTLLIDAGGLTVVTALRDGDLAVLEPGPAEARDSCAQRDTLLQRWLCRLQHMVAVSTAMVSTLSVSSRSA